MPRIVRESKVRHVYAAQPSKHHTISGLGLSSLVKHKIKASSQFVAFVKNQCDLCLNDMWTNDRIILPNAGKGDFEFSPFFTNVLYAVGENESIKVWDTNEKKSVSSVNGHQKRINVIQANPTVHEVLASGANEVKIWDTNVSKEKAMLSSDGKIYDLSWSPDGSVLASSSRDKIVSIIDPRTSSTQVSGEAHDSSKPCKMVFLNDSSKLITVGFSKSSMRSFKLWDLRTGFKEFFSETKLDQAAGVLNPFYDESLNVLYLAGRGEGNIRYFELTDTDPWVYKIDEFRSTVPCKDICTIPKKCLNVKKHEVMRLLKFTSDSIERISFFCPRKSEVFQEDIYPPCRAGIPSVEAKDYFSPDLKLPIEVKRTSMDPELRSDLSPDGEYVSKGNISHSIISNGKSEPNHQSNDLDKISDLDQAKKYITLLTDTLKQNGINVPSIPN